MAHSTAGAAGAGEVSPPARSAALHPVETSPGVLVHPSADRRLAVEHWLLSTVRDRAQARHEWTTYGTAMLPLGTLFSAVRIPAPLVLAAAGEQQSSPAVDEFLDQALDSAPVICYPRHARYYVLVPARMPITWHQAVDDWRVVDVDCLGRGTYLGIPALTATDPHPHTSDPYWSVPMPSAAALCPPLQVARLIAAGQYLLTAAGVSDGG